MIVKISSLLALLLPLVLVAFAEAQHSPKLPRIGILELGTPAASASQLNAFKQGLRELGYVDGKNILLVYRYADGTLNRLPELATDLADSKVDAIVTRSTGSIRAAMNATKTIPIIFPSAGAPVEDGLVASLARPGGNATGLSLQSAELDGKKLELLKQAFPKISRVGLLWTTGSARADQRVKDAQTSATALGIQLQALEVTNVADLSKSLDAAKSSGVQALSLSPSPLLFTHRKLIFDFVNFARLPVMYSTNDFVESGGLMSYGPDILESWKRAATYVDKILKGAKPADLPVEQPTKFELVINLKAAKESGLTIQPNVLARADRVIK